MKYLRRVGVVMVVASAMALSHIVPDRARAQETGAITSKTNHPQCNRTAFRVALDVGHTVTVPGAISARGVAEYTFNMQLAKQIEKSLIGAGFSKTVLFVTTDAPPLGLLKRVARANAWPADLFLSIHHDSVPENLMEKWEFNGEEHHYSDRFPGHALFVSFNNVDSKGSLLFGRMLGERLKASGLQYTPHYTDMIMGSRRRELVDAKAGVYRYDQLIVLRHTHMPAVLLEAGSIVNREEELQLATPERQALIAIAVTQAVETFCAARNPRILSRFPATSARTASRPAKITRQAYPPADR